MDEFTRRDLKTLTARSARWCISILQPAHRAGAAVRQDPIRFRNLLRRAVRRLDSLRVPKRDAKDLLAPLLSLWRNRDFWRHQREGLAVFRAPGLIRVFRLPAAPGELLVVAERFHLKPLLPFVAEEIRYYVLAISQNRVRLFAGTRYRFTEVPLRNVPRSLAEALRYDDPERQLQFHTGAPAAGTRRAAMFHGHGAGVDDAKSNLLRFCRLVDAGLQPYLKNREAPLVLAGVEYLLPLYRRANSYPRLLEANVPGNPDALREPDLHAQTLPLVESLVRCARAAAAARFRELSGTGRTATDIVEVIAAARQGRVDTLFVAAGRQRWGTVVPDGAVRLHIRAQPGDEDLLNRAALHTLAQGGIVYAVDARDVPGRGATSGTAAVFRY